MVYSTIPPSRSSPSLDTWTLVPPPIQRVGGGLFNGCASVVQHDQAGRRYHHPSQNPNTTTDHLFVDERNDDTFVSYRIASHCCYRLYSSFALAAVKAMAIAVPATAPSTDGAHPRRHRAPSRLFAAPLYFHLRPRPILYNHLLLPLRLFFRSTNLTQMCLLLNPHCTTTAYPMLDLGTGTSPSPKAVPPQQTLALVACIPYPHTARVSSPPISGGGASPNNNNTHTP